MNKSEAIAELAEALSKAQSEMRGATKDSTNPHYKSSYADLSSVWDACRDPLTKNGLSVTQTTRADNAGEVVHLVTTLLHKSGQYISSEITAKPSQNTPQGIGSTLTYLRRYSLSALVGIAPEDDDGNAASQQQPQVKRETPKSFNKDAKPSNRDEKEAWHDNQKPPIRPVTNPPQIVEKQTSQTDLTPKQEAFIKSIETEFLLLGINGKTKADSIQKAKTLVGDAFEKAVSDFHKFVRSRKISKILETAKTEEWDDATKITYFSGFGNGNLEQNDDSIINEIYADLKNSQMIKG